MYGKKPQALGDLIDDFIEDFPNRISLKRGMILSAWPDIVGLAIAEQTENLHFKGDKLFLQIANPAWRHEVHMQRHTIAAKLNRKVNEKIIREIIVKA